MTNASAAYPGGSPGMFFSDPRLLPRWYETTATLLSLFQDATARAGDTSNFFAELAVRGVAVDTNWTGSSKKTLLSSSSPTLLYHVVGPAQGVGETAIYEIVVDGVTYTLPTSPAATAGCRTCLGPLARAALFTTADANMHTMTDAAAASGWDKLKNAIGHMPPPMFFSAVGAPCLYASRSLTVSITVSANITGTASQERQAGVAYRVVA